jgi:hypothetical protein
MTSSRLARLPALVVLLAAAVPAAARADCAAPLIYGITATGPTVQICPDPYAVVASRADCPGDGLLRVDSNGGVVLISTCDDQKCYVDECVPAGTYRYGRKTPFACQGSACGTYYYGSATLSASADGCTRTLAAPVAYVGALPWGSSDLVCAYRGGFGYGCSSGGAAPVLGFNALLLLVGLIWWAGSRRAVPGT